MLARRLTTILPAMSLAPTFAHLDCTSCHVDGRYNRDAAPSEQAIPITRGDSRDHRPDLHQVMLDRMVEQQAGISVMRYEPF
jgi:transposase